MAPSSTPASPLRAPPTRRIVAGRRPPYRMPSSRTPSGLFQIVTSAVPQDAYGVVNRELGWTVVATSTPDSPSHCSPFQVINRAGGGDNSGHQASPESGL